MKTTGDYIQALHAHYGTSTTYALAKAMQLGDQTVRGWTKGHTFSDQHAVQVAEILGIDPGEVLAAVSAERTKSPEARQVWERIADQLSSAAASLALAVICAPLMMGAPTLLIMSSDGHRLRP